MKILITSIVDLQKSAPGRLHWFIRHLSKKHEITVLSLNDWWKASKEGASLYTQDFDIGSVAIHHLTERRISPVIQELTAPSIARRFIRGIPGQKFDIHLNYNTLISGYGTAKKLKPLGIKTVYDIADDLPKMIGNSPQIPAIFKGIGKIFGKFLLTKNINISDKVTFVTTNLQDIYPVPDGKKVVIPNGVDIQMFRPQPVTSLRQELGIDGAFVVGFVGTLREWVDLNPVFIAVKQLFKMGIPVKMLVIGDDGGAQSTRQLAKACGVSDHVKFTGTVPYVRVPDYTCAMDVCVMPLKFDNAQPLSLLQYLACGKPVISTRPLEITPGVVLYARDSNEYARYLVDLAQNPSLREELGVKGRKYVETHHDWMKIGERLEALLFDVADLKGSIT